MHGDVLDLYLSGLSEPIGTTASHPFWSVDRQDFIKAGQLRVGEILRAEDGRTVRVLSKTPRSTAEAVFNLEVHAENVYCVSSRAVLVHNNGCKPSSPGKLQREVEKGQAPRDVDRVDNGHIDGQEPHVHYKDGTSSTQSGGTHDAGKGTPNPSNKVRKWLEKHGWTPPAKPGK